MDENNYSIQEEGWLGILFLVGTIFFSGLLLYGFIDGQADFSVIVAYGILIAFSGICTLHLFLWRVKVNHDVIEYRSFFGKKYYKFSDITRSVHKENGTLEIYAGDKIIFKFDENISASLFANSLSKHKISQETWLSCRDKKCIIRPKESHYVLPGIFFLYLVYNSVILVFNAKETAFVFLLFSLVPGGIFFYFYDKNNAKLVYYDTIEEAIQLSTLNAENEELSVPADFLNHVDETLHIWQGKKYDTIFYRAGNDNDDIQGLVMARCKKQIQNGHTQYAFINATPVTTKRDRILLDDITELIHSSLKLSDFQQDLNPDYPSKRFVYGYAHDKEIYSLEVEGQKPDGVIEINVYDRVMYLWYYNDLQSNKRGDCLSYSVDVPK